MADLTPITREEKIIAGEDVKPVTREEKILAGMDIVPVTRREKFLKAFGGGGSSGGDEEGLKITNASYLFFDGARLDYIDVIVPLITDCKDFGNMFASAGTTNSFKGVVPKLDTSKGTSFINMFKNAGIKTIPQFDTSNGTDFRNMFQSSSITSIPKFDTSKGTEFDEMFAWCLYLTSVPELDTSSGTTFKEMFYYCRQLTSVPELDTSRGKTLYSMFSNCEALTTITKLDVNKATDLRSVVSDCKALTNLYLYNIRKSIQIGSGTSWGHLLTVDSLVHTIKELCTVTSTQKLTIGSANLEKIANLYCKITDDTHEKKTMELCESTDEGAMTLSDYAAEKGWQIL